MTADVFATEIPITICMRDGSESFPKRIPPHADHILSVEWSWAMFNSRMDKYKAAWSRDRKRIFVWAKDTYWVEGDRPTKFEPYCSGPCYTTDLWEESLELIGKAWEFEKANHGLDAPHMITWLVEEYEEQIDDIQTRIWGNDEM